MSLDFLSPPIHGVEPSSPLPPESPRSFPSSFASESINTKQSNCTRIADYFLVLGRQNDDEIPLTPVRRLSRSNSQSK
jgi:hypothetical protein